MLSQVQNKISFLYVEYARIERTQHSVQLIQGTTVADIPIATINCILIGPGVTITHGAVALIHDAGCTLCWTGQDGLIFYAYGEPGTNKSRNLLLQIKAHDNKQRHINIARKMYMIRYPTEKLKTKTLQELRGVEGLHVRELYTRLAEKYKIKWDGRTYLKGDFDNSDTTNQYLTALNHALYAITTAVVVTLGFSPAIGFIHTGHLQSFTFDIADLYKETITIPLAFELSSNGAFDRHLMLTKFRQSIENHALMQTMPKTIISLFDDALMPDNHQELSLWDNNKFAESGKNYGCISQKD